MPLTEDPLEPNERMLALLESLDARLSRLETKLEAASGPHTVAAVVDTVDGLVARAQDDGVDLDAHLAASLRLTERLTRPDTVRAIEQAVDLAEQGPAAVAGVIDTADSLIGRLQAQGVDFDVRTRRALAVAERITREDTVEQLEQALDALAQAPGLVAGAVDTVDGLIARLDAGGVNLDERLQSTLSLAERLSRPETTAQLHELLDVAETAPGLIAGAVDTVDSLIARMGEAGVHLDDRLADTLGLAERLTRKETVAQLHELLDVAETAPGMIAGAVDTVDGLIARLHASGISIDDRLQDALGLAERLTRPEMVSQLHDALDIAESAPGMIAGAVDTMDGLVARLDATGVTLDERLNATLTLAERLSRPEMTAQLNQLLDVAETAPGLIAGTVDTLDSVMGRIQAEGINLDERFAMLLQAAEVLTRPEMLSLVHAVLERQEDLQRLVQTLLDSGVFEEKAVSVVGGAGQALVESRGEALQPVGAWAALTSIRDPDVGRALAFGLNFARKFGRKLSPSA